MQAKLLKVGDKVKFGHNVWTVERTGQRNGMTFAIGKDAKGVKFALNKKDHYEVTVVQ